MGLQLDKERSLKLFAMSDSSGDHQIGPKEFNKAMLLLKMEIAHETLKKLGLTLEDLIWFAVGAL